MKQAFAFFAFLVLSLNIYSAYLFSDIRTARIKSLQQQALINQGIGIKQINNQFINTLASISARNNDKDIREILASEGVTFTINSDAIADEDIQNKEKTAVNGVTN